jgi:MFS family permease
VRAHLRQSREVFGTVFRNRDLGRVLVSFGGFASHEFGVWVAVLVYAYQQGGTTAAGVVAVVQLVPATLFAPFASVLADRLPPARVLLWGYLAQAVATAATAAVILADGPPYVAYALAAVAATTVTLTRPTLAALTPSLSREPEELTAANVVSSWIENVSIVAGPVVTGVLLGFSGVGLVLAVMAAAVAASALLVAPLAARAPERAAALEPGSTGVVEECAAGFQTLANEPAPRLVVGLLGLQFVVWGAFDVLAVALAIQVLDMGEAGAGYLNAAFGAGGVIGGVVTAALVGRRRLAPALAAGMLLWALAFLVLGVFPTVVGALLLLAVAGVGNSLADVAGRTLLQRTAREDVLARVFGVLEGLSMAALAIGSIAVPLLVAGLGTEAAFIAIGAVFPLVLIFVGRRLRAIDEAATVPVVEIALLRSLPIFAPLPAPELEGIARGLQPLEAAAGTVVVTQGQAGYRYYAVADGDVDISVDGDVVQTRGRGEGFGEIALLHNMHRTATVTAKTDVRLYALEKDPFVAAVTGNTQCYRAAAQEMRDRAVAVEAPA